MATGGSLSPRGVRLVKSYTGVSGTDARGYTTGLGPRRGSRPAGQFWNIVNSGSRKSGRRGLK